MVLLVRPEQVKFSSMSIQIPPLVTSKIAFLNRRRIRVVGVKLAHWIAARVLSCVATNVRHFEHFASGDSRLVNDCLRFANTRDGTIHRKLPWLGLSVARQPFPGLH